VNDHVHSRAAYVAGRRSCPDCRAANAAYEAGRNRLAAYDRSTTDLVDAGPVREHLAHLRAAGVGWRQIVALSGVDTSVVRRLVGHSSTRPARRVRPETAEALLAVTVDARAPGALVDADPVWRLIHGMIARGYTRTWIAEQLGPRPGAGLQLHRTRVTRRQADAVRALAERCALTPGPSARARAEATRQGWNVAWLWEDVGSPDTPDDGDELDMDPVAVRRIVAREGPAAMTPQEQRAAIAELTRARLSSAEIAVHLGLSARTVVRYRARARALGRLP
jgi:DNA-binding CsgD family transcriptional regulator